jgi:D-alanyl-D-alanine carboxypeptidase
MWSVALSVTIAILICFPSALAQTLGANRSGFDAAPNEPVATFAPLPNVPLPACTYTNTPTPLARYDDWALTLLDTNLSIPASYVPPDLVSTRKAGLSGGGQVRAIAIPDLAAMARAAAASGAPLAVLSAYRNYRQQAGAYGKWIRVLGRNVAPLSSARPGHSEHQLGLAIDFESRGGPLPWNYYDWSADTAAGRWMAAHAWQYGFVMSYPNGKIKKTCYGFEPWHYRYVGRDEAAAVHASKLTLREWLWKRQPLLNQ